MAIAAITIIPTIVKNGGPITSDVYKSHATDLWTKGTLLKFVSGLLEPVVDTNGGDAEIDTDDTGTGVRLFVALEDHLTAGSVFISVQEIKRDTIIEAQILDNGSGNSATSSDVVVGTAYAGYQIDTGTNQGSGLWGIDSNDTTNPVFSVVDVQSNYEPFNPDGKANYAKCYVKVLSAILA
jgi:hypothetical protein